MKLGYLVNMLVEDEARLMDFDLLGRCAFDEWKFSGTAFLPYESVGHEAMAEVRGI